MSIDLTRFDFHALRFKQSEDVLMMTDAEVGQYLLLMIEAWLGGKDASLPNKPEILARYARCEKVSDRVMAKWQPGPDGRLYNERLSEEWAVTVDRYNGAREDGRKGGKSASEAKVRAARENGKLGGRPAKEPDIPSVSETQESQRNPSPDHAMPMQSKPMPNQANANAMAAELPQTDTGTGNTLARDNVFLPSTGNDKGKTVQGTEPLDRPLPCYTHSVTLEAGLPQLNCNKCYRIKVWIDRYGRSTQPLSSPIIDDEDLILTPGKAIPTSRAIIFAHLLYAALPQDRKAEAAEKWEELWAEDIQGLISGGESPDMIERVLRALPRLARLKYVYRGDSFVSMYEKLKADLVKLEKKPGSSFLMDKIKQQEKELKSKF